MDAHCIILPFGPYTAAVIRIREKDDIRISVSFSQVGVMSAIRSDHDFSKGFTEQSYGFIIDALDGFGVADFDEEEERTYTGFTARLISTPFDYLHQRDMDNYSVPEYYESFSESFRNCHVIPGKSTVQIQSIVQSKVDFTALYFKTNPHRFCVLYSRNDAMIIHRDRPREKLHQVVKSSALPKKSIYSPEWITGRHAEVIAFMFWNQALMQSKQ